MEPCSCLIYTEGKAEAKMPLNKELIIAFEAVKTAATRVGSVKKESKIDIVVNEYVGTFKVDLMEIAYEWCKGAKFGDICRMTEVFEGTIIRCFRRLEELLEQIIAAGNLIANQQYRSCLWVL